MKKSFRRSVTALLLSGALLLSSQGIVTVFADNGGNSDMSELLSVQTTQEQTPCTKTEGCTLTEGHEGECVLEDKDNEEQKPCTKTEGCTLTEGHEGDCVVESNDDEQKPCTKTEGCTLTEGHEGNCVVEGNDDEQKPCTKTEGCTLTEGHEGNCVVEGNDDEQKPCTKTEGCTLTEGHEGECVVEEAKPSEAVQNVIDLIDDAVAMIAHTEGEVETTDGGKMNQVKITMMKDLDPANNEELKALIDKEAAHEQDETQPALTEEEAAQLDAARKAFEKAKAEYLNPAYSDAQLAARNAYNALAEADKPQVTNYSLLEDMEANIAYIMQVANTLPGEDDSNVIKPGMSKTDIDKILKSEDIDTIIIKGDPQIPYNVSISVTGKTLIVDGEVTGLTGLTLNNATLQGKTGRDTDKILLNVTGAVNFISGVTLENVTLDITGAAHNYLLHWQSGDVKVNNSYLSASGNTNGCGMFVGGGTKGFAFSATNNSEVHFDRNVQGDGGAGIWANSDGNSNAVFEFTDSTLKMNDNGLNGFLGQPAPFFGTAPTPTFTFTNTNVEVTGNGSPTDGGEGDGFSYGYITLENTDNGDYTFNVSNNDNNGLDGGRENNAALDATGYHIIANNNGGYGIHISKTNSGKNASTIENCTIQANGNGRDGFYTNRSLTISNSTIIANDNAGKGVNISNKSTITNSSVETNNNGSDGFYTNQSLTVSNSTIKADENKSNGLNFSAYSGNLVINNNSTVTTNGNKSNGLNVSQALTAENSTLIANNNTGKGVSVSKESTITKSGVETNNNGNDGFYAGAKATVTDSSFTVNFNKENGINFNSGVSITNQDENTESITASVNGKNGINLKSGNANINISSVSANSNTQSGLYFSGDSFTTSENTVVNLNNNKNSGLYINQGTVDLSGADVTIMKNSSTSNGGGIYNNGNLTLPSCNPENVNENAKIYNNHAEVSGDDIYNADGATITNLPPVGTDWYLDGEPDCTDKIDGWYDDSAKVDDDDTTGRWSVHADPQHIVPFKTTSDINDVVSLKAAHGILKINVQYEWVGTKFPTDVSKPANVQITKGTAYTATVQKASNQGYTFKGWYTDESLNIPFKNGTVLNEDTILYGYWIEGTTPPGPGPDPDPEPENGGEESNFPRIKLPTTTIDDEDVPLADLPEDTVTIDDEEVPLKDVPNTGDMIPVPAMVAAAVSLGGVLLLTKKRK